MNVGDFENLPVFHVQFNNDTMFYLTVTIR